VVIVRFIGQKLSSLEHKNTLIGKNYGQLFSQILGETLLIVTNIGPNPMHLCFVYGGFCHNVRQMCQQQRDGLPRYVKKAAQYV
jgi:hypothetical protein